MRGLVFLGVFVVHNAENLFEVIDSLIVRCKGFAHSNSKMLYILVFIFSQYGWR